MMQLVSVEYKIFNLLGHIILKKKKKKHYLGGDTEELDKLDGISQWQYLNGESCPPRNEILHNIDDVYGYSALRMGKYKYVNGKWCK